MITDRKGTLEFADKDIATIEALHDMLLDHDHKLNEPALNNARDLTDRMYKALGYGFSNQKLYKEKK